MLNARLVYTYEHIFSNNLFLRENLLLFFE